MIQTAVLSPCVPAFGRARVARWYEWKDFYKAPEVRRTLWIDSSQWRRFPWHVAQRIARAFGVRPKVVDEQFEPFESLLWVVFVDVNVNAHASVFAFDLIREHGIDEVFESEHFAPQPARQGGCNTPCKTPVGTREALETKAFNDEA